MIEKSECEDFRRRLKPVADDLIELCRAQQHGANLNPEIYRHLEDASMRLGNAIQAIDGGISVYDKDQVPDVHMGPTHG